jgi:hypothetical protein
VGIPVVLGALAWATLILGYAVALARGRVRKVIAALPEPDETASVLVGGMGVLS